MGAPRPTGCRIPRAGGLHPIVIRHLGLQCEDRQPCRCGTHCALRTPVSDRRTAIRPQKSTLRFFSTRANRAYAVGEFAAPESALTLARIDAFEKSENHQNTSHPIPCRAFRSVSEFRHGCSRCLVGAGYRSRGSYAHGAAREFSAVRPYTASKRAAAFDRFWPTARVQQSAFYDGSEPDRRQSTTVMGGVARPAGVLPSRGTGWLATMPFNRGCDEGSPDFVWLPEPTHKIKGAHDVPVLTDDTI